MSLLLALLSRRHAAHFDLRRDHRARGPTRSRPPMASLACAVKDSDALIFGFYIEAFADYQARSAQVQWPLWVIRGDFALHSPCPLYPQKRTCARFIRSPRQRPPADYSGW